mmetsp:Transcript_9136/g.20336  ORF Transcript_9136/g.20336 Transcript_9136/m.20336 type:complete len:908 (-) Transcript_9136:34-2757(-)
MSADKIVNYYAALEIEDENADETTIKKAYRKLVLKWHPDKHPEQRQEAEDRIREINNAYEVLSNPTKRSTYDQQRRAVNRKAQGFGPPPTTGAPRMRIPKEFMMVPIGHPDKFVRYQGRRLFVQSRRDARDVTFQAFFEDTKWSLWWLPEINNMCRVRALGSRARGEKTGVAAGLCGGLNLSFYIDPMNPRESEVCLEEANKGEKVDKVNFLAVPSPIYENAFRFEAAYRKGYYLVFLPPTHCRVAQHGEEGDAGVCDFALVDFSIMFKFIEMEEVLQPVVAAKGGWVTLPEIRQDSNILMYFQNILQKPVWDNEDFVTYFDGHWETWEYDRDKQAVRLRPPEEKLAQLLNKSTNMDEMAATIASAKDEIAKLPVRAAVKALLVLAKDTSSEEGLDISKAINRVAAQKRILSSFGGIITAAVALGKESLPLSDLLDVADLIVTVGGSRPSSDIEQSRQTAQQVVADIIFAQLGAAKAVLERGMVARVLTLPGAASHDKALAAMCQRILSQFSPEQSLEVVKQAGRSQCTEVADTFATSIMMVMDSRQPEPSADEQAETLRVLASAGTALDDVARRLQGLAARASPAPLAAAILALGERGYTSTALAEATQILGEMPGLSGLETSKLMDLAVASTKSSSLAPAVSAVAMIAASAVQRFQISDLVRLLLAIAKAKGALKPEMKAELLKKASVTMAPELGSMAGPDLIKLILAIASDGKSDLLEEAAAEAIERRISSFQPAQLMILTQGIVQGLGGQHRLIKQLVDFWIQSLRDAANSMRNSGDDDEITRRRQELEQKSRLSADQLVTLAKALRAAESVDAAETLGSQLTQRAGELSEAGKKALEAQLAPDGGLSLYSGKERLRRAVADAGKSRSRSRDRRRRRGSSESRSRSRGRRRSSSDRLALGWRR